jgi:hypothetical protein
MIVRSVLGLGKSLDIPVLAEGVETHQQLEFLHSAECHEVQGYYFGRPTSAHQIRTALASGFAQVQALTELGAEESSPRARLTSIAGGKFGAAPSSPCRPARFGLNQSFGFKPSGQAVAAL